MSSKWSLYKNILNEKDKKKYETLFLKTTTLKQSEMNAQENVKSVRQEYLKSEAYLIAEKYFTEHRMYTPEERLEYDKLIEKALNEFPMMKSANNIWSEAIDNCNRACRELEAFRKAVYILYELPEPETEKTDDKDKQCGICMENKKDQALPCGHVFCGKCIPHLRSHCPNCKKNFSKEKVIKLFL